MAKQLDPKVSAAERRALTVALKVIERESRYYVLPPYNWHVAKEVLKVFGALSHPPTEGEG